MLSAFSSSNNNETQFTQSRIRVFFRIEYCILNIEWWFVLLYNECEGSLTPLIPMNCSNEQIPDGPYHDRDDDGGNDDGDGDGTVFVL